jgi:hypothetical protein
LWSEDLNLYHPSPKFMPSTPSIMCLSTEQKKKEEEINPALAL